MAREKNQENGEQAGDATTAAAPKKEARTAAQAAAGGAGGGDGRSIVLRMKDGTSVKRTDYIRARWAEGADRGTIKKEVNAMTAETFGPEAKEVPYQVIFQATKGHEGGPAPKTEAAKSE